MNTAVTAQPKDPRLIQAAGAVGCMRRCSSGGFSKCQLPPPAWLNRSWPRLKRSPYAFAVIRADHAVAVIISIHLDDIFARRIEDLDQAAVG
jgi:hypothetical protein